MTIDTDDVGDMYMISLPLLSPPLLPLLTLFFHIKAKV